MKLYKNFNNIVKIVAVSLLVSSLVVTPVMATPTSDELKEEQQELQQEANSLSSQLSALLKEIETTKNNIKKTQNDLTVAGEELEQAEVDEYEQYEAMKLRIRFIYEESSSTESVERIFKSKSIVDMLNQVSYVNDVHNYDRDMLAKYVEVKEAVIKMHAAFEEKLFELEESQSELSSKQNSLNKLLADKQDEIETLDEEIKKAIEKEEAEAAAKAAAEAAAKAAAEAAARAAAEAAARAEAEARAAAEAASNNSSSSDTNSSITVTGSGTGVQVANYGMQFIGNRYVYGGTSLTNGTDCSGFTMQVYAKFGYKIPRTSYAQRSAGIGVSYSNAQVGDIICYSGHVALYIGNGMIVHASNSSPYPSGGIKTSPATYAPIVAVRRIIY